MLEITNYELLEGVVFKKIYMSNVEFSEGTEFVVNVEQGNLLMDYPHEFYSAFLIMNINNDLESFDIDKCNNRFDNFKKLHDIEVERLSGNNNLSSIAI